MNANGNPQTLVPAESGNTRALKHGVYSLSGRVLAPRAEEIATALMELPHAQPLDVLAAEEIGSLLASSKQSTARSQTAASRTSRARYGTCST